MRKVTNQVLLVTALSFVVFSCVPSPYPTATPTAPMPTKAPAASTPTQRPEGETIIVVSPNDSGHGSLRQALLDAQSGDTITFDPQVFPPNDPTTIALSSGLPRILQGNLTLDASNAGVILDGSSVPGEWVAGLSIDSAGNTVQGLQVSSFSGPGIAVGGAYNLVGGDRSVGTGPSGQGNLTIHNDVGIGMWGSGASFNTVMGNLIGSDATGADDFGDRVGVEISEGANGNTIGPDNVIAYSGEHGINVRDQDSLHNTITGNSIHDNDGRGIGLPGGANIALVVPAILAFDVPAGTVTGIACQNCTVEVFSDSDNEGQHFEGQTTADGMGVFALDKGTPFVGPHLTATATDLDGTTSAFSLPTWGTAGAVMLQIGNDSPATRFQTKQAQELLDNRIGAIPWYDFLSSYGVKRTMFSFNRNEPPVRWDVPELEIRPEWDAMVTRFADDGFEMKYILTFWDKATYTDGEGIPCPRFKTEGEIENYLEYVRFIVNHFKDRIQYYELWNEPDVEYVPGAPEYCTKHIEVDDYINLVRRTVPVIREVHPEAKIAVGAVSGLRVQESQDYLFALLESDIMPLVDVISWHPLYSESPEYDEARDYWYAYPSLVQEIKDTANAHGFEGEYQVDELSWWDTSETAPHDNPWVYSPIVAEKYTSRAIVMHLGRDITASMNRGADNALRVLCTAMAGALPVDLTVQIQTTATNTMSYTFALPNDDYLVAYWNDSTAVEHDAGIRSMLIVPGFAGWNATAIDVLYGFEQELVSSNDDGDLIIRDILIKDYPVIIRLSQ